MGTVTPHVHGRGRTLHATVRGRHRLTGTPSRVMAGALPPLPDTVHVRGNDGRCDWCADAWPCAFEQQADQERWQAKKLDFPPAQPHYKPHFLSRVAATPLVKSIGLDRECADFGQLGEAVVALCESPSSVGYEHSAI